MPADPLSLSEREETRAGIERGEPLSVIAGRLGRHRCTVSAEVNRNGGRAVYRATAAQTRAVRQRARPKAAKLAIDGGLASVGNRYLRARPPRRPWGHPAGTAAPGSRRAGDGGTGARARPRRSRPASRPHQGRGVDRPAALTPATACVRLLAAKGFHDQPPPFVVGGVEGVVDGCEQGALPVVA